MSCKRTVLALALASIALAGNTQAVPISYTEPPDLAGNANFPTLLGTLDVGVNTVTGSIDGLGSSDFRDSFGVTLPGELRITSITLNVSNYNASNAITRARDFDPFLISFNQVFTGNGLLNLFNGAADGPGNLVYEMFSDPNDFVSPSSASFNYVWSITVESIPSAPAPQPGTAAAPGTLMLVGASLAGFFLTRRRKEPAPA
jgi:hypothetical protein